jgi:DNA-binding IclR family transcriptional regulator
MRNTVAANATLGTLDRAVRILQTFSAVETEFSISELSRRVGIHKSVVSRIVARLRTWRLLEQDPSTKRVRIGIGAFQLGALFVNGQPIHRVALPQLAVLVERIRHSAHITVLDPPGALVVASVESPQALRVILRVGQRLHLHATAAGKVLLAFSPPALREGILAGLALPALTDRTLTSVAALRAELATVAAGGVAWNGEETTRGAGAVAAPVFGADAQLAAALCAVYPLSVVDAKELTRISDSVRATAGAISALLGGAPPGQAMSGGNGR